MYWSARPEQRALGQEEECALLVSSPWAPLLTRDMFHSKPFQASGVCTSPMSSMSRNPHLRFTI